MQKHIPKEKNLNFNNLSNKSDLSSISKFSKSSDNLEYYQNMANSSLKVSQLQKIQDTANENPIQLQTEDNLYDKTGRRTKAKKPTNNNLEAIPEGIGEGDDSYMIKRIILNGINFQRSSEVHYLMSFLTERYHQYLRLI